MPPIAAGSTRFARKWRSAFSDLQSPGMNRAGHPTRTVHGIAGVLFLMVLGSACTSAIDLKQALQVTDLTGGWLDGGIVDGKNKLVPTVSFRVRKNTDQQIRPISLNVHFRRFGPSIQGGEEEFEEVFLQRVEFSQGNQPDVIRVQPKVGYTGDPPQSRAEMLKHSQFVDMRVIIFAKQSSSQWVELTRYDIPRQLITH